MKTLYLSLTALLFTAATFSQQAAFSGTSYATSTNFQVAEKNNAVEISWTATDENNMRSHEIQKSVDGFSFYTIGTLNAQNENGQYKYIYTDATPVESNNYYRLRSVDVKGNVLLSNVLKINDGYRKPDLLVLPNPSQTSVLNLQLLNFTGGKYSLSLYSSGGLKIFARSFDLADGSSTETINLPLSLNHGLYFLQVTDGEQRFSKQIIL